MNISSAKLELSRYDSFIRDARSVVALREDEDDSAYIQIDSLAEQIKQFSSDENMLETISKFFGYNPNFDIILDELEKLKRQSNPNYKQCYGVLHKFEENLRKAEEISRGKKVFS